MSSWVRGAKTYAKRTMTVPFYYDITTSKNIASTFLELLGAFIYSRKQNENCTIYDPNGLINDTLRYNPGIKMIKEVPENTSQISLASLINTSKTMKFPEIQQHASTIFQYMPAFNTSILQVIQKASIRGVFDIALHITANESGNVDLAYYVNVVRDYQKRIKKANLSIYVMADSFQLVTQFQKAGDNGWSIVSLSKFPVANTSDLLFQEMAEVQIFAVVPAAVLDFSHSIDRFIFLMQRNPKGYAYMREVKNREWAIDYLEPPRPVQVALPAPVAVAAPVPAPVPVALAAPVAAAVPAPVAAHMPAPAPVAARVAAPLPVPVAASVSVDMNDYIPEMLQPL
jgi:hypothetical protein